MRIADEIGLNENEPYVEILEILENSIFVALSAKTHDEEKNVAVKAPVNNIIINDLNLINKKNEKNSSIKFSYSIKVADFYYNDTALIMLSRIKIESLIENPKVQKISDKKYRVYLGPFNNINSLQKSYNAEHFWLLLEIIKND